MLRALSIALTVAAIGFLAAGVCSLIGWLEPLFPSEHLSVAPDSCELGDVPAQESLYAEFRLHNRLDRPIQVLGCRGA